MKLLTQAASARNEQKRNKRRLAVFLCLAAVVALGTVVSLKMYGQAMSHKEKRLICQLEVHEHTPECYDGEGNLVCGYADYVVHTHNDDCYDSEGNLVCPLPEIEAHTHTDECYAEEKVLVCQEEETPAHEHTEECYTREQGELLCQLEEHIHTEECYDENGALICQKEEHQHDDSCYEWKEVLTCEYAGENHQHDDSCYTREQGNLLCQLEEHIHTEECYDENGALICEKEEHQHDDSCYEWNEVLACQLEEGVISTGHTHTDECYETQKVLTCGQLELHTHDESCYDENGALICGQLELKEHVHQEECFEVVELSDEEVVAMLAKQQESVSADKEGSASENEAENHVHDESCYDAAGGLICGYEAKAPTITKTYKDKEGKYIITAAYDKSANIPEDAKLKAEMITAESDEEYYAQREAEMKEALEDETVEMDALFKIGFYVDGEEIEPESDVMVTVQFLDENGLADGTPMTIVHFGEDGNEVLGGSHVKDGSTTFKTGKFSYFGIIRDYVTASLEIGLAGDAETAESAEQSEEIEEELAESGKILISENKTYTAQAYDSKSNEMKLYDIEFQITGKAEVPAGADININSTDSKTDGNAVSGSTAEDSAAENSQPVGDKEDAEAVDEAAVESEDEAPAKAEEEIIENAKEERTLSDDEASEETQLQGKTVSADQSGEADENQGLKFEVELLDKEADPQIYKAVSSYAKKTDKGGEELLLDILTYSVTYNGVALDTSDCEITARVTPSEGLLEQAREAKEQSGEWSESMEEDLSAVFTLMAVTSETEVSKIGAIEVTSETVGETVGYIQSAEDVEVLAVRASGQPNPKFTVQYYANLDVVAYNDPALRKVIGSTSYTNELPVIDTTGGKLPANGGGSTASPNGNEIRNLYVDMTTGKLQTKTELTEVYSSRDFEYHKAPTINYMNALVENPDYELKEVWVLKTGRKADSTNRNDWDIHTYSKDLHFTNREVSAESGEYVLISDGATLRFVYDTTDNDNEFESAFYDYDIGDGMIYSTQLNAQKQTGGKPTSTQGSGTYHMHTNQSGINSPGNYTGSGAKLAFGNANTGSGLQHELWGGNLLNKANQTQSGHPSVTGSYKGCTFGLVTGLVDGKIQYAGNVNAPNLFNDGSAAGKTSYDNGEFSLTFNRVGDTYTLTTVNGTGTGGLDTFNHPSPNASTVHNHIWTNNFWPMDSAASFGTDGHDMKFGDYTNRENYKFAGQAGSSGGSAAANGTFPWSDDGEDHNSYFGMHYNVEFDLVEDYVGPLEYYFFGDDDMWVFLDGKMVCDIGGVHSSVGEYVNLWDYLEKGSEESAGKHTLSFFYTERGESGSTCWMQFTLPSVSSLTPETTDEDYGHLKIEKTVTQIENGKEDIIVDNNDEFTFTVHFTDANGKNLPDDYSYVKYDKNGNEIGSDLIIWDGGEFTLKNGEYIIVKFLPQGAKYEITEANTALTVTDNTSEKSKTEYYTDVTVGGTLADDKKDLDDNKTAEGDISKGSTSEIKYNNKIYIFQLPKTGGPGATVYVYMAVLLLASSAVLLKYKLLKRRREGIGR